MANRFLIIVFLAFLSGCATCPPCPPCKEPLPAGYRIIKESTYFELMGTAAKLKGELQDCLQGKAEEK